jgi:hypothetical protein
MINTMELHHSLFELIPGVVWGNPASMVWGAFYLAILAWIGGWYIAWDAQRESERWKLKQS